MLARDEEHRQSVEDVEGIVGRLENALDEANRSAEASTRLIEQLRDEVDETKSSLADTNARLAERDDLMNLLRGISPSVVGAVEPQEPKRSGRAKKDDGTQELPL